MIDRILHHVHSNADLNCNRYGFTLQSGTVEAAMAVKEIIGENLKQKNCISVVSLDVQRAFDTAWWPSILHNLEELKCPKNIFSLSRSYFSNRTASLCENKLKIEKPVTMGSLKFLAVVQGFGIYSTTRCLIWTSFTVLG
jgi:hypothetical protein